MPHIIKSFYLSNKFFTLFTNKNKKFMFKFLKKDERPLNE